QSTGLRSNLTRISKLPCSRSVPRNSKRRLRRQRRNLLRQSGKRCNELASPVAIQSGYPKVHEDNSACGEKLFDRRNRQIQVKWIIAQLYEAVLEVKRASVIIHDPNIHGVNAYFVRDIQRFHQKVEEQETAQSLTLDRLVYRQPS